MFQHLKLAVTHHRVHKEQRQMEVMISGLTFYSILNSMLSLHSSFYSIAQHPVIAGNIRSKLFHYPTHASHVIILQSKHEHEFCLFRYSLSIHYCDLVQNFCFDSFTVVASVLQLHIL